MMKYFFLTRKKHPKAATETESALKTQQRGKSLLLNATLDNPLENLLPRLLIALGGINITDKNWSNKCTPWVRFGV